MLQDAVDEVFLVVLEGYDDFLDVVFVDKAVQVLFGETGLTNVLTTAGAFTMLVFSLLYAPCVAAVASIKRELGAKWAVGVVLWQCVLAWIVALIVKLILTAAGVA